MPDYRDRMGDYVEVKDRIRLFYEEHPDGRLVTDRAEVWLDDDTPRVVVKALAYRTVDDPHPGVGWSWMVLPGSTPYTKGSELENTETSAWGRAIGALGIGIVKSIATGDEIESKAGQADLAPKVEKEGDGFIGIVEVGKPPVDMNVRQTPQGAAWGFKLKSGRTGFQALAVGPLADALAIAGVKAGERATVWGSMEEVPWQKGGKDMPPFARIHIERVRTTEWELPAVEAESIPLNLMDQLTDDEKAAIGGSLPA